MRSNITTEASFSTRVKQYWAGIPFITSGVAIVCCAVYLLCLFVGYDSFEQICFWPAQLISHFQVYRAYTAVLFHGSFLHVMFNMLALMPIGSTLERIMGSVRYLHVIFLLATCNAALHLLVAFIAAHNPLYAYDSFMNECTIGFSGIIFSMIVMEIGLNGSQIYSVFGFFNVPAKWYPWILLILFQLLMPNVSLLGHLCGIFSGFAYTYGLLNYLLLRSSLYSTVESSAVLASCVRSPRFIVGGSGVPAPISSLPTSSTNQASGTVGGGFWRNLNSWVPRRSVSSTETAEDSRFPGRGRVLGASPLRPSTESELQTRLLERTSQPEMTGRMPILTNSSVSLNSQLARRDLPQHAISNTENQGHSQDLKEAIQSLISMGFEKDKAEAALVASNGDLTLAVDVLSNQG